MKPTITVITPSFNQGHLIAETIESVLQQNYPSIQYMIIDGGSDDSTRSVVQNYRGTIDCFISEPDRGQAHAINKGLEMARGDIVAYLNSDDLYEPGALARVAEEYMGLSKQARNLAVISGAGRVFGSGIEEALWKPAEYPNLARWISSPLSLFQPATFWTRNVTKKIGSFDESFRFCMDKEYFLRALLNGSRYIPIFDQPLAAFRVHSASKTSKLQETCRLENKLIADRYRFDPRLIMFEARRRSTRRLAQRVRVCMQMKSPIDRVVTMLRLAARDRSALADRFYQGGLLQALKGRMW